jgi:hypothetical protein
MQAAVEASCGLAAVPGRLSSTREAMDGYRTQSPDTSREAEELQFEAYRRMSFAEKLAVIDDLNRTADGLARAGIRERHPNATDEEIRKRLAALWYGREFTVKWLGWDPNVEGW